MEDQAVRYQAWILLLVLGVRSENASYDVYTECSVCMNERMCRIGQGNGCIDIWPKKKYG